MLRDTLPVLTENRLGCCRLVKLFSRLRVFGGHFERRLANTQGHIAEGGVRAQIDEFDDFDALADTTTAGENCVQLVYVGGVRPHRGLDQVVRALAELPQGLDVRLRIVGARGRY